MFGCTRFRNDDIVECHNGLNRQYERWAGASNGPMDEQLAKRCGTTDVPDFDFDTCEENAYMCCWTHATAAWT